MVCFEPRCCPTGGWLALKLKLQFLELSPPCACCRPCTAGADILTDSPRFWSEAYSLRHASGSTAPAAPSFLAPLADSILAAGKAALLLNAYSSWRLAAAAARGSSSAGGSSAQQEAPSPSKRRLSEYGALGFAIAAGQGPGAQPGAPHPYGVPPPAAAAPADSGGPAPLLLHQQLVRNLEGQLQEQLGFGGGSCSPAKGVAGPALMAAAGGSQASSGSSGSHACHEEWQQACAACGDHTLLLPPEDTLPPLPVVPASADRLPAAQLATIQQLPQGLDGEAPTADAPAGAAEVAAVVGSAGAGAGGGHMRGGSGGQPTIADRMRAAAAARTAQARCTAAAQLPLLIIPPAPLEALAAGAGSGGAVDSAAAAPEAAAAAQQAQQAKQFDGAAWQEWYARVASALSHQLQMLDSIGASGSGYRPGSRQPAGPYGVPLGLPRYSSASPSEQLWCRGSGLAGSSAGAGGSLGAPGAQPLQPELAAAAPPLDVLMQHSLLRPVRAQVDAASGALCTALLRHGLLRQVRARMLLRLAGCRGWTCCMSAALEALVAPLAAPGSPLSRPPRPPATPVVLQLAALRDTYLLGSPLLEPFVSFLLRSIRWAGGM